MSNTELECTSSQDTALLLCSTSYIVFINKGAHLSKISFFCLWAQPLNDIHKTKRQCKWIDRVIFSKISRKPFLWAPVCIPIKLTQWWCFSRNCVVNIWGKVEREFSIILSLAYCTALIITKVEYGHEFFWALMKREVHITSSTPPCNNPMR